MTLILALAMAAAAQESTAQFRASTTSAQLGVPTIVEMSASAAPGVELSLDLERSTTDVYSLAAEPVKIQGDGGDRGWKLTVVPLAVGRLPVKVYWTAQGPSGGRSFEARFFLDVGEPRLAPDAEIADIKKPARARPALWPWLLALAAGGAALWLWKRAKKKKGNGGPAAPPPETRPPGVAALAELDALEASPLWAQRRYKEFYAVLTEALRRYFERRFEMPALKLTTGELARQLRLAEVDRKAVGIFKDVFERADLVKFAKIVPAAEQGPLDLDAARELVRLTSPADLAAGARS